MRIISTRIMSPLYSAHYRSTALTTTETLASLGSASDGISGLGAAQTRPPRLSTSLLSQADFPHVPYWDKDDWLVYKNTRTGFRKTTRDEAKLRGTVAELEKEDLSLGFIMTENGTPINKNLRDTVRRDGLKVLKTIKSAAGKKAPKSWERNSTMEQQAEFNEEMETRHPILRLCSFRWKPHAVAIELYSHIKTTTPEDIKVEADENNYGEDFAMLDDSLPSGKADVANADTSGVKTVTDSKGKRKRSPSMVLTSQGSVQTPLATLESKPGPSVKRAKVLLKARPVRKSALCVIF